MAAKAQARLDEEIVQLASALSILQTQKNTFALISRLPPPILARIFVFYVRDDYDRPSTNFFYSRRMTRWWIAVSFVCHHWRHVALTCPTLWSYLFVASPWWTETLLSRSLDSPLRIFVTFKNSAKTALDFITRVAMHTERLQECCLSFTWSSIAPTLSMLFPRPAPILRILNITFEKCKPLDWMSDSGEDKRTQMVNDRILFNGDTPMLRELELTNCGVPWYSPTLGGLTVLRLRNLAASIQLTMAELRAILRRMPDLVELYLDNALRGGLHCSSCQDSEKLRFPSLSRLFIDAPFSETVALLSYVEVPPTVLVSLRCHQETHPGADDFILFYSFLSRRFAACTNNMATTFIPIRSIGIRNANKQMHFIFSASESGYVDNWCYLNSFSCNNPLTVDLLLPLAEQDEDIVFNVCQSVPLAHLRSIILDDCRLSSTFWMDNFWHLQELRSIKLIGRGLLGLISTLSIPTRPPLPNTEGPKGRGPRQVFAPALENLELENIGFKDNWEGDDDIYSDKVARLRRVLARRERDVGHALSRLELTDCWYLFEDDVSELADVVDFVDWDERTHDWLYG